MGGSGRYPYDQRCFPHLNQQLSGAVAEDFFRALKYYYESDAFLLIQVPFVSIGRFLVGSGRYFAV